MTLSGLAPQLDLNFVAHFTRAGLLLCLFVAALSCVLLIPCCSDDHTVVSHRGGGVTENYEVTTNSSGVLVPHGKATATTRDGVVLEDGYFVDGARHGDWVVFDADHNLIAEETWDHGNLISVRGEKRRSFRGYGLTSQYFTIKSHGEGKSDSSDSQGVCQTLVFKPRKETYDNLTMDLGDLMRAEGRSLLGQVSSEIDWNAAIQQLRANVLKYVRSLGLEDFVLYYDIDRLG